MKKLLFSISFIIIVACSAMGQKLQYGLQGALGFATQGIDNPDILSTNSVTTYAIHALVDIPFKRNLFLQTGLGIIGKGVKEYQNAETNTITLTYLDIPVTALYKVNLPTLGKVYFGVGPYASLGLSGNNTLETVSVTTGSNVTFGNAEDYRKIDLGVNFKAGLELNNHLTFNMRYSVGLNNIASDQPDDVNTTAVKNRVFTVGLGFWL